MIHSESIPVLREGDLLSPEMDIGAVGSFPSFDFSMHEVRNAGDILAGHLIWNAETEPNIRQAFTIATNWRNAHSYPMRSVRYSLQWHMRKNGLTGTTASRLKRMPAIRKKLARLPENLSQLQDIGGCRVILPSMADVRVLASALRHDIRHTLRKEQDYIARPKPDGYRSHHLMYTYCGKGPASVHDGRRIEVQVRTRLQHAWATAVEAIGLFRGENLKGDIGSPQWLRLFYLMSAEFAEAEGCPVHPNAPDRYQRQDEIKWLDKELEAVSTLENISYAVKWSDGIYTKRDKPSHFLLLFNNRTREVEVRSHYAAISATKSYDNAEFIARMNTADETNTVLVEVDRVENLKLAYPNYFGDVMLFKQQLKQITKGKAAQEYMFKPLEALPPRHRENPDFAWLKRRIRWWE